MFGQRGSILARRALVVGAAGVTAVLLGAGVASADVSIDKTINFNGDFPIIGNLDPIQTETIATAPSPVTVGTQSADFPVTVKVDAPSLATSGLETVNAATVQGTATIVMDFTDSAGQVHNETVNLTIPSTPTPADGSDLTFVATGTANIPAIANAGAVTAAVDQNGNSTTLDPKQSDGTDTVLGTFTVTLNMDSGQDPTLGTIQAQ
ncbi:MAG TPA: DUF6801 domain-containing protein [Pseudonocardiaceae bacterium]|nr:DUF6801 domain-containing protein [Pseudonocardiaceae bacterium]